MCRGCIHLNKYINQDNVLNCMKTTPDHALKNLILTGIYEKNQTLEEIREYVRITPYEYEDELGNIKKAHYNNESGLTSGINYLKNRGFITIYPKDKNGQPIKKPAPTRPYVYYLNERGYQYLSNPNRTAEHKEQVIEEMAVELANGILENSDQFKEAVERRAKEMPPIKVQNRIEKPVLKPVNQIVNVQMDDTEKKNVPDSNNEIVQELKAQLKQQELNHSATIQEYVNYIRELEYTLTQTDVEAVKKHERNLSREDKIQQRYALAIEYANNNYFLDEYFFKAWGGDYIIAALKKLMELGQVIAPECIDIFSRNSDLYKRRQSRIKRIITGEDIINCEFYIKDFTDSFIIVSSRYLEEDKTLKW